MKQGQQRLMKYLDIVNLIEIIKGYRVMSKVLFNQKQLLLLKFQRHEALYSTTEESSENQQLARTVKDLVTPVQIDDLKRKKARGTVSNTLRSYESKGTNSEKLSQIDQRILQSILTQDFKKKEEQKIQDDAVIQMRQRMQSLIKKKTFTRDQDFSNRQNRSSMPEKEISKELTQIHHRPVEYQKSAKILIKERQGELFDQSTEKFTLPSNSSDAFFFQRRSQVQSSFHERPVTKISSVSVDSESQEMSSGDEVLDLSEFIHSSKSSQVERSNSTSELNKQDQPRKPKQP